MPELIRWFSQVFWGLLRIGGFLMVVPIFGNQLVSRRIRIAMTLAIAIAVAPLLSPLPVLTELSLELLLEVLLQLVAGVGSRSVAQLPLVTPPVPRQRTSSHRTRQSPRLAPQAAPPVQWETV